MAARRPFWKWHRWKSIGFCLWPPSTCIWNLKLKFQSKLELCSGNHVVYRQTDGRTDRRTDGQTDGQGESSIPPSNFVGRGYKNSPKFQIFEFWNGHYTGHTFLSCLIRCANMKWIRWVLLKIQSGHDSVHGRTDGRTDRRTRWYQYTPLSTSLKRGYNKVKVTVARQHLTPPQAWLGDISDTEAAPPGGEINGLLMWIASWNKSWEDVHDHMPKNSWPLLIDSMKTTTMENVSTGVLNKEHYLRSKDKA